MKRLLYFLREENYVTVRKNDVNKAFMLLYEKYSSFIFLSYFTPHHPFQWVKYSSNQKIIWNSVWGSLRLNEWVRVLVSSLYMVKRESNEEIQRVFYIFVSDRI